jgi:hypothetical protein
MPFSEQPRGQNWTWDIGMCFYERSDSLHFKWVSLWTLNPNSHNCITDALTMWMAWRGTELRSRNGEEGESHSGFNLEDISPEVSVCDCRHEVEYPDIYRMSILLCESDKMQIKRKARWLLMKFHPFHHPPYSVPRTTVRPANTTKFTAVGMHRDNRPPDRGLRYLGEPYEYS